VEIIRRFVFKKLGFVDDFYDINPLIMMPKSIVLK